MKSLKYHLQPRLSPLFASAIWGVFTLSAPQAFAQHERGFAQIRMALTQAETYLQNSDAGQAHNSLSRAAELVNALESSLRSSQKAALLLEDLGKTQEELAKAFGGPTQVGTSTLVYELNVGFLNLNASVALKKNTLDRKTIAKAGGGVNAEVDASQKALADFQSLRTRYSSQLMQLAGEPLSPQQRRAAQLLVDWGKARAVEIPNGANAHVQPIFELADATEIERALDAAVTQD